MLMNFHELNSLWKIRFSYLFMFYFLALFYIYIFIYILYKCFIS